MSEPPRTFERSQLIALSVEDYFAFFADAYKLEAAAQQARGCRVRRPLH